MMRVVIVISCLLSLLFNACEYCVECERVDNCIYCTDSLGVNSKVNCFSDLQDPTNFKTNCNNSGGTVNTADDLHIPTDFCGNKKNERTAFKQDAEERAFICIDK